VDEGKGLDLEQGAGDQGLMYGFACDETPQLMPVPIYYSHRLMERHGELRKDGRLPWLRPDAKSQVTVRYLDGKPVQIETVVISTQHHPDVSHEQIKEAVIEEIIKPVFPKHMLKNDTKYLVNPTGRFVIGGPMGYRLNGTQDHRRHLRRLFASRRRRVFRARTRPRSIARPLMPRARRQKHRRRAWRKVRSYRSPMRSASRAVSVLVDTFDWHDCR
jgi:hypothetical protein